MENKKNIIIYIIFLLMLGASIYFFRGSYALFAVRQELEGSIVVPENNYCINNGFDTLSECILVMENYSPSVESAKTYIASKGTPNFSQTAPSLTYREEKTTVNNSSGVISTTAHFTLGSGYTFNSSTGMFNLTNYINTDLTDDYINYYTCGSTTSTYSSCAVMYQIKAYTKTTDSAGNVTYLVTSAVQHGYHSVNSLDSEVGLYQAEDDTGNTYYFRGDVKNNYVSFAGYIWRVVRVNGNGSVRLIYSGTSTNSTGSATILGNTTFNSRRNDPTFIGYMYGEDFALNLTQNATYSFTDFNQNESYYFGESYVFDESINEFRLTGNTIYGTWASVHDQAIASYPYSCFSTSPTGTCTVLKRVSRFNNNYTATATLLSYSSKDYASTLTNTNNSNIKGTIDTWYISNILNKTDSTGQSYANYISDEIFCNDRSVNSGSGYLLSPTTTYGANRRISQQKSPSLVCPQESDAFTVSTANGNGNLTYPIGLLTADEVSMAGGMYGSINTSYYLCTGQMFWLMSPYYFNAPLNSAVQLVVASTGRMDASVVNTNRGIRPVINLSSTVLVAGGDGTASNPFTVSLN